MNSEQPREKAQSCLYYHSICKRVDWCCRRAREREREILCYTILIDLLFLHDISSHCLCFLCLSSPSISDICQQTSPHANITVLWDRQTDKTRSSFFPLVLVGLDYFHILYLARSIALFFLAVAVSVSLFFWYCSNDQLSKSWHTLPLVVRVSDGLFFFLFFCCFGMLVVASRTSTMSCWRVGRKNVCVCVCVERVRVATGARKTQSNNVLRFYVYLSRSLFASMNIYFSPSLLSVLASCRLILASNQSRNTFSSFALSRLLAVFFSFSLHQFSARAKERTQSESTFSFLLLLLFILND